jgi:hypothetical protein
MSEPELLRAALERLDNESLASIIAAIARNAPSLDADEASDRSSPSLLPKRHVADRYSVSLKTVNGWIDNPALQFPQPVIIGGRLYWRVTDLVAWERARATPAAHAAHRARWRAAHGRSPTRPQQKRRQRGARTLAQTVGDAEDQPGAVTPVAEAT